MKICIERSDRMGDMILTLVKRAKRNPSYNSCCIKKYKYSNNLVCVKHEKSTSLSSFNNLINSINAENMIIILLFHPVVGTLDFFKK